MDLNKRGRPRKHENHSERRHAHRELQKKAGKKDIRIWLTQEQKDILDKLCGGLRLTQAEVFGYLLECAMDRELPDLEHSSDESMSNED